MQTVIEMDYEQDEYQTPTYEGMSEEEKKDTSYKRAVWMRIAVWVILRSAQSIRYNKAHT